MTGFQMVNQHVRPPLRPHSYSKAELQDQPVCYSACLRPTSPLHPSPNILNSNNNNTAPFVVPTTTETAQRRWPSPPPQDQYSPRQNTNPTNAFRGSSLLLSIPVSAPKRQYSSPEPHTSEWDELILYGFTVYDYAQFDSWDACDWSCAYVYTDVARGGIETIA